MFLLVNISNITENFSHIACKSQELPKKRKKQKLSLKNALKNFLPVDRKVSVNFIYPCSWTTSPMCTNFYTVHAMSDMNNIYKFRSIWIIFSRFTACADRQTNTPTNILKRKKKKRATLSVVEPTFSREEVKLTSLHTLLDLLWAKLKINLGVESGLPNRGEIC